MRLRPIGLALLGSACLLAGPGRSAPRAGGADDSPAAEAAVASGMASEELKRWSIRAAGEPARPAEPRPDPVLRYSNPGVGRVYGEVFLFVADGRPEAVLTIYKWFTPWTGFEAEMHSLADGPLTATRDGRAAWRPGRAGVRWEEVPGAPAPAASAPGRLGQIRSIAGGFAGRLVDARVDATGRDQALRLLPKPLHRHPPHGSAARDGALFAFVLGTDPEVFLLLETTNTPPGPRWRYSLARMNRDPIQVTYQGREVWKAEKVDPRTDSQSTYFSMELPQAMTTP